MELNVHVDPKGLRETLCVAQAMIIDWAPAGFEQHIKRLQLLINECDRHRLLGPDGKHGSRHTMTCGCELENADVVGDWEHRDLETGRHYRNGHILSLGETMWHCENCDHRFDAAEAAQGFVCGEDCKPWHVRNTLRVNENKPR